MQKFRLGGAEAVIHSFVENVESEALVKSTTILFSSPYLSCPNSFPKIQQMVLGRSTAT